MDVRELNMARELWHVQESSYTLSTINGFQSVRHRDWFGGEVGYPLSVGVVHVDKVHRFALGRSDEDVERRRGESERVNERLSGHTYEGGREREGGREGERENICLREN
jgi:hypothetical protein